ncbi:MAG: hypothetical protein QOC81_525, partial [Thermoanaerobaculia bacterium]|nr:hypothetical protein [Thermoanaerobaculia bacterium]
LSTSRATSSLAQSRGWVGLHSQADVNAVPEVRGSPSPADHARILRVCRFGQVQVDWLESPPSVTGAGFQRTPVFGQCGARFQVGAGVTPQCGVSACGRDSIGSCQGGCQRRLCGLHGAGSGSFVCADCAAGQRQREKLRQDDAHAAMHARAADCHQRLVKELRAANSPEDLLRCLTSGDEQLPVDLCVHAWITTVESGLLTPSAELVHVRAQPRLFSRATSWVEAGRLPAWKALDAVWVDPAGDCWTTRERLNPNAQGAGGGSDLADGTYVVPPARPFHAVSRRGSGSGNQQAGYSRGPLIYSWTGAARVCRDNEAELVVDRVAAITRAAKASSRGVIG